MAPRNTWQLLLEAGLLADDTRVTVYRPTAAVARWHAVEGCASFSQTVAVTTTVREAVTMLAAGTHSWCVCLYDGLRAGRAFGLADADSRLLAWVTALDPEAFTSDRIRVREIRAHLAERPAAAADPRLVRVADGHAAICRAAERDAVSSVGYRAETALSLTETLTEWQLGALLSGAGDTSTNPPLTALLYLPDDGSDIGSLAAWDIDAAAGFDVAGLVDQLSAHDPPSRTLLAATVLYDALTARQVWVQADPSSPPALIPALATVLDFDPDEPHLVKLPVLALVAENVRTLRVVTVDPSRPRSLVSQAVAATGTWDPTVPLTDLVEAVAASTASLVR